MNDIKENLGENNNETPEMENSPQEEADAKKLRHAQQMEGAKREVERAKQLAIEAQVKLASIDATNLLELARTDLSAANAVAKKF